MLNLASFSSPDFGGLSPRATKFCVSLSDGYDYRWSGARDWYPLRASLLPSDKFHQI